MNDILQIALVTALVGAAISYLIARTVRARRTREWETGHSAASCSSCPVIEVRKQLVHRSPVR